MGIQGNWHRLFPGLPTEVAQGAEVLGFSPCTKLECEQGIHTGWEQKSEGSERSSMQACVFSSYLGSK